MTAQVKQRAQELGANLVGICSAKTIMANPPDLRHASAPQRILNGAQSVIVLGRRLLWGPARSRRWDDRSKHYTAELNISRLEDIALELVLLLEDAGYPATTVPSVHTDMDGDSERPYAPLSLSHAAVEAGLGTLGLNGMLLTPEYGPRVLLGGLVTIAPLECDEPLAESLCPGAECGRCLEVCPGDAVGHWELDFQKCLPYASPWGWERLKTQITSVWETDDLADKLRTLSSSDTFMIWQSMLRGVGIYTGCTRCLEVCPVGADYALHLAGMQGEIPETTPEKTARLETFRRAEEEGRPSDGFRQSRRWIEGPGRRD